MPVHKHDCDCCVSLGTVQKDKPYDLYFCEQNGLMPTVIARYGSDGDYYSGLWAVKSQLRQEIEKGFSFEQSLENIINQDEDIPMSAMAQATKHSLEQGLISQEFKKIEPQLKSKMTM